MAKHPTKDQAIVEAVWALMAGSSRRYWHDETMAFVERVTRKDLIGRYTDQEILSMVQTAREKVADDLSLPPWDK